MRALSLGGCFAAALVVAGCGEPPRKVSDLPGDAIPLHLDVSNQSADVPLVYMDIFINGIHVVTGDLDFGDLHLTYGFELTTTPGEHTIHAEATGQVPEYGTTIHQESVILTEETFLRLDYHAGPNGADAHWVVSSHPGSDVF